MTVADRMAVMQAGTVAQVGTPDEIYEHPASRYVADFIGDVNLLQGRVVRTDASSVVVACDGFGEIIAGPAPEARVGETIWLALRPEKIAVSEGGRAGVGQNEVTGTVVEVGYRGEQSMLEVRTAAGSILKVSVTNRRRRAADGPAVGESVRLTFAADDIVALTR